MEQEKQKSSQIKTFERVFLEQMASQKFPNMVYISVTMTSEGGSFVSPFLVEMTATLEERKISSSGDPQPVLVKKPTRDEKMEEEMKAECVMNSLRTYREGHL